jgi:two-component system, NtrC family, response regulator HydG
MKLRAETPRRRIEWRPDPRVPSLPVLLGKSRAHLEMVSRLEEFVALEPSLVVLAGETGTGKSLVAREVHRRGRRRGESFYLVPCGTLPTPALEEELFGASDGRFPGMLESAAGGTIHLDDADRLAPSFVHRLRRYVLRASLDAPMILLSSRRIAHPDDTPGPWDSFPALHLPPLRQRGADVELLARMFLGAWAGDRERPLPALDSGATSVLYEHPWPGNVRELRDTMERAADVAPGTQIREEHLRIRTRETRPLQGNGAPAAEMIRIPPEGKSMDQVEAEVVRATLRITGGNRSQAARILGISRPTLARKIRRYGAEEEGLD